MFLAATPLPQSGDWVIDQIENLVRPRLELFHQRATSAAEQRESRYVYFFGFHATQVVEAVLDHHPRVQAVAEESMLWPCHGPPINNSLRNGLKPRLWPRCSETRRPPCELALPVAPARERRRPI